MSAATGKGGFSLVELMICLGLAVLVVAAAGLMYYSGVRAWVRSENQAEVQQNLRIALNTLNAEIRKADAIEVYRTQKKITLTYHNGASKSYRFNQGRNEIWLDESNNTVAMHIRDCSFDYDGGSLLTISVTTRALEGIESSSCTLRINTRGKTVHGYQ